MTAVTNLISRTRQYLQGGKPERRNTLSANINDTATSVTLTYDISAVAPNSRVSIDLEDMHVYAINTTTKTLTVTRGDYGTTAASHTSGDVVLCGALHSSAAILQAFNDTLDDLEGRGLYAVTQAELTHSTGAMGYDLTGTSDVLRVLSVESKAFSYSDWVTLDVAEWRFVQGAETDDFASGNALFLTRNSAGFAGQQLRVWYATPFTALTTLAQDAAAISGLDTGAEDLLVLGAAVRLASTTPMLRNELTYQPDLRRSEEVPPGASLAAPSNLRRLYESRVEAEVARQDRRYPIRMRVM